MDIQTKDTEKSSEINPYISKELIVDKGTENT